MTSNWCKHGVCEACRSSMQATNGKRFRCQCQCHVRIEAEAKAKADAKAARRRMYAREVDD